MSDANALYETARRIARDLGCDVVLPDIDEVQYQMNEGEAADAYLRYDELRASCEALR